MNLPQKLIGEIQLKNSLNKKLTPPVTPRETNYRTGTQS